MKKRFLYSGPISDELRPNEVYELEDSEARTCCLRELGYISEVVDAQPTSKKRPAPAAAEPEAPKTQRAPKSSPVKAPKSKRS